MKVRYTHRVLIVIFDGAPPEALQRSDTPNVDKLIAGGASTFHAQSTLPTWTLQCMVSHLAGVTADKYELLSDPEGWLKDRKYPIPSIFDLAHSAGLKTAMFNNWQPLNDLPRPGTVDRLFSCEFESDTQGSTPVVKEAVKYLLHERPALCFVHFDDPDAAGHKYGWRSSEQCRAVRLCDEQLGMLMHAIDEAGTMEETTVFVSSDHAGGKRTDFLHGDANDWTYTHPLVTTVPWICCGPGVKRGYEIKTDVSICDTAATVAFLLGFEIPESWEGKVVQDAIIKRSAE